MNEPSKNPKEEAKEYSVERAFLAMDVLPEPAKAFGSEIRSVEEAIEDGDIVVDTNVLLLPYGAGPSGLNTVVETFKSLAGAGRLFMPAQVAREFVRNRPTKVGDLYQGIADKMSKFQVPDTLSYPILKGIPEFEALNTAIEKAASIKSSIKDANSALLKRIRSWEWNDPVSQAYRSVFTPQTCVEPTLDRTVVLDELRRRHSLSIPPGYKDASKDDYGIGDFLIWKTILSLGEQRKKDLIFVSGDEKADWQHRAGGSGFLPRFELLEEYRRASDGKAFYIVSFSRLLELLKVAETTIKEIKAEEKRLTSATSVSVECPHCGAQVDWRIRETIGSSALPRCPSCNNAFHINRTRQGIVVHRLSERGMPAQGESPYEESESAVSEASVLCPLCSVPCLARLGTYPGATTWSRCEKCAINFPVHRRVNGSVFAGTGSWRHPPMEPEAGV